jgi:selenocysteine lyase/cysteine desulfurase
MPAAPRDRASGRDARATTFPRMATMSGAQQHMTDAVTDERIDLLPGGDELRAHFPIFRTLSYLNTCAQAAGSDEVRQAYLAYLDGLARHGSLWPEWMGKQEAVRALVATLLHAPVGDVSIVPSVSAGVNALASSIDFSGTRNTVVTCELDFPTTGQIWHAQRGRGADVVSVAAGPDGRVPFERFEAAVDERTAVVSVAQVSYRTGAMLDVAPLIRLAHARGALFVLDAYQSAGTVEIDMRDLQADVVVGGCLKYLLGSPGVAYLVTRQAVMAGRDPSVTGWLASRDVDAMWWDRYEPASDGRRFEGGTPAVPSLFAAEAGLRLMLEVGVSRTREHVRGLMGRLRDGLAEIGATALTPPGDGPLLVVGCRDGHRVVAELADRGVVVSERGGNIRISLHCYNTTEDIDRAVNALDQVGFGARTP